MLTRVEEIIPKWKIVPAKDVIDSAFKDPVKREEIRNNKLIYQDKPRLKTALEMLRTSMNLEDSLDEVTLPFFVLHGEADTVTDPEVSEALYERASSKDKTIKLPITMNQINNSNARLRRVSLYVAFTGMLLLVFAVFLASLRVVSVACVPAFVPSV